MNNAELIMALRNCAATWNTIDDCSAAGCPFTGYGSMCIDTMLESAADALEAAEQRIAELEAKAAFFDAENLNYQENIEYRDERIKELEAKCSRLESYNAELQRTIKSLQAQIPKRGECKKLLRNQWINYYECSICGNRFDDAVNYCPNCGADMRGERDEKH